jgi:hypothetical protein
MQASKFKSHSVSGLPIRFRDYFKEILSLHKKNHKIAECHTAKERRVQLCSYSVLGNPKQENLRICKWEPKKRDPTR